MKKFFEDNGLEVIDAREQGGRLWVLGEKTAIRDVVNTAISKFGISGKYAFGKETKFNIGDMRAVLGASTPLKSNTIYDYSFWV